MLYGNRVSVFRSVAFIICELYMSGWAGYVIPTSQVEEDIQSKVKTDKGYALRIYRRNKKGQCMKR